MNTYMCTQWEVEARLQLLQDTQPLAVQEDALVVVDRRADT